MNKTCLAALAGAAILTGYGCSSNTAAKASNSAPKPRLETVAAISREVEDGIEVSGTLAAAESSDVVAEVEGVVSEVLVNAGDRVAAGAPLIRLNPANARLRLEQARAAERQARAALDQSRFKASAEDARAKDPASLPEVIAAKANWDAAEADWAAADAEARRCQQLLATGDVSRAEYDRAIAAMRATEGRRAAARQQHQTALNNARQDVAGVRVAEAQLESARAAVALQEKQMNDTTVRAPFAGAISARFLSPGEFAGMGTKVAVIEKLQPLRVYLQVAEAAAAPLRPGLETKVHVESYPGETFPARVVAVNPVVQAASRAVTVEATLPNADGRLKPGMFVRAKVVREKPRQAVFVPRSAVVADPNTDATVVWLAAGGRARLQAVRLGVESGDSVEAAGIPASARVISRPAAGLYDGMPIEER